MVKEAEWAEMHRSLVEVKLSNACVRIDKLECSTDDLENRLMVLERHTRMWESLEERYQTVLTELVTKMCREIQDKFEQDLESLKREIEQQRGHLHVLKSVYVKADMAKSRVQVKQPEHITPGGVSPGTSVNCRRRLPSLPEAILPTYVKGQQQKRHHLYNDRERIVVILFGSRITHSSRLQQN